MQKTYRYLPKNRVTVVADVVGFITEYRPVYQRTLQVYRGIDNLLYFEVKNHDQKPISLAGYTPKLIAFDENNNQVLEKLGSVYDDVITKSTAVAESAPDANLEFSSVSGIEVGQTVTGLYLKSNTLVKDVDATGNLVTLNKSPSETIPLGTEITFQTHSKKGVFTVNITENELLEVETSSSKELKEAKSRFCCLKKLSLVDD